MRGSLDFHWKWNTDRMSLSAEVKAFIHLQIGYVRKESSFINSLRKIVVR